MFGDVVGMKFELFGYLRGKVVVFVVIISIVEVDLFFGFVGCI